MFFVCVCAWMTFSGGFFAQMSSRWQDFVKEVYFRGVDPAVRKEVYVLGQMPLCVCIGMCACSCVMVCVYVCRRVYVCVFVFSVC